MPLDLDSLPCGGENEFIWVFNRIMSDLQTEAQSKFGDAAQQSP